MLMTLELLRSVFDARRRRTVRNMCTLVFENAEASREIPLHSFVETPLPINSVVKCEVHSETVDHLDRNSCEKFINFITRTCFTCVAVSSTSHITSCVEYLILTCSS